MSNFQKKIDLFLKKNKFKNYQIKPIKGDASFRKYFRIILKNKTYILAYSNEEKKSNIYNYVLVSKFLKLNNFKAPKIICHNFNLGFVLLEDLGKISFYQLIKNSSNKFGIYKKLINCLIKLQKLKINNKLKIKYYNYPILKKEIDLFFNWYLPYILKLKSNKSIIKIRKLLHEILKRNISNDTFVHRDFHVSNLMSFNNKVGIIDSQDALIGSKAYDLVSLIDDVRIRTTITLKKKLFNYYLAKRLFANNESIEKFRQEFAILSVQRAMKIIGIFSRLSKRDKKPKYLSLIPYTWSLLNKRLEDPIFDEIRNLLNKNVKPLI